MLAFGCSVQRKERASSHHRREWAGFPQTLTQILQCPEHLLASPFEVPVTHCKSSLGTPRERGLRDPRPVNAYDAYTPCSGSVCSERLHVAGFVSRLHIMLNISLSQHPLPRSCPGCFLCASWIHGDRKLLSLLSQNTPKLSVHNPTSGRYSFDNNSQRAFKTHF